MSTESPFELVEVAKIDEAPRALAVADSAPSTLLRIALERGADLATLERLMALQIQVEERDARKAFTAAMTQFKAEPMEIFKRKRVEFTTRDGETTAYNHAELSDITDVVCPAMARHQLSHRWCVTQDGPQITVDCIITHVGGHSEKVTMRAAPDASGKKNAIQQIASAVSYLSRYTLLAATGMSTKGMDDDGKGCDDKGDDGKGDDRPGHLAEKILVGLLADLKSTTTDAAAAALWASGSKTIAATASKEAYAEFKDAVITHRKALKGTA